MVIGGENAGYDVEVIDLKDENKTCSKPKDCPLKGYQVGAFVHGAPFVCEDKSKKDCYFYDAKQGTVHSIVVFLKQIQKLPILFAR